jgi:hypothetical protein
MKVCELTRANDTRPFFHGRVRLAVRQQQAETDLRRTRPAEQASSLDLQVSRSSDIFQAVDM